MKSEDSIQLCLLLETYVTVPFFIDGCREFCYYTNVVFVNQQLQPHAAKFKVFDTAWFGES